VEVALALGVYPAPMISRISAVTVEEVLGVLLT